MWWVSWEQEGFDGRPVAWPPPTDVLAFWESGQSDEATMVVALVRGDTEEIVCDTVEQAWNPGVLRWRFSHLYHLELDGSSKPPGDRFGAPSWSVQLRRWPW